MTGIRINPGFKQTVWHEPTRSKKYCDYRDLWRLAPIYNFVGQMPIHLDLEVTARCQLKCPGCPSMKLKYGKGSMDVEMAKNAMAEHATLGGLSVKFNWRGEPTLYPYLAELVKEAYCRGYQDIMINTNGVALSVDLSRQLIMAGITNVAWSIDAITPKRYAKLRPGAMLSQVLKNLGDFCTAAENLDSDVFIRVQRIEYPDEKMTHDEFAYALRGTFPRVNAVASNAYKEKDTNKVWEGIPSEPCAQPWQRMVMTFDGKVGPCCEMNRFGKPFGTYPKNNLYEIWHSKRWDDLRWEHWMNCQDNNKACKNCTVTKVK